MKLLKQRFKRVVVCLLALSLLLQPVTAYAYKYDDVKALDTYVGKISELQEGQELPADSLMLVDFYFEDSSISNIINGSNAAQICDALFYVQEADCDYMSTVYTTEGVEDDFRVRYATMIFKLGNNYNGKEVNKWRIKKIEEHDETFEVDHTSYQYDHTPYIYKVSDNEGQSTGQKDFTGFRIGYVQYIRYKLIEVEPMFDEPETPATVTFDANGAHVMYRPSRCIRTQRMASYRKQKGSTIHFRAGIRTGITVRR